MGPDDAVRAEDNRPFDAVFKFADVSRPVIVYQQICCRRRDAHDFPSQFSGVFFDEIIGQQEDVCLSLPEGRNDNREDAQPVVKVFAELSFFD